MFQCVSALKTEYLFVSLFVSKFDNQLGIGNVFDVSPEYLSVGYIILLTVPLVEQDDISFSEIR